jgi:hypothetical protein
MNVMTTGMHQTLVRRGPGQGGALLDRQSIHIHPQSQNRSSHWTQLRHDTSTADRFAHVPAQAAQFPGHQSSRLPLMTTELRMTMDMAAQLNQIREQVLQLML